LPTIRKTAYNYTTVEIKINYFVLKFDGSITTSSVLFVTVKPHTALAIIGPSTPLVFM